MVSSNSILLLFVRLSCSAHLVSALLNLRKARLACYKQARPSLVSIQDAYTLSRDTQALEHLLFKMHTAQVRLSLVTRRIPYWLLILSGSRVAAAAYKLPSLSTLFLLSMYVFDGLKWNLESSCFSRLS